MKNKIIEFIKKQNLIEKNDNIVIGFSGGPDSVFLLHILNSIKKDYKLNIVAIHINHLIRKEAKYDEEFSKKMAKELGIEFKVYEVDVPEYARINKLSVEDAGRRVRYEAFQKEALLMGANSKIAVAHHKDDLAETVIMNVMRGSGSNGLVGIREKNNNVIRPILCTTKKELLKYLDENNIDYVVDETNEENDYRRNQIRNIVIPYIKDNFNENIASSIWNMSNIIKEEQEFIDEFTNNLNIIKNDGKNYYLLKKDMSKLHKAIQRNVVFKIYEKLRGNRKDLSYNNVETILSLLHKKSATFEIQEYRVYSHSDKIIFSKKDDNKCSKKIEYEIGKTVNFSGYIIKSELVENKNLKYTNKQSYFDPKILKTKLELRTREEGDTINLNGFSKKIKKEFIDKKIDKYKRDTIPILTSDQKVVWALGVRRSNLYNVTSELEKVVKISFER